MNLKLVYSKTKTTLKYCLLVAMVWCALPNFSRAEPIGQDEKSQVIAMIEKSLREGTFILSNNIFFQDTTMLATAWNMIWGTQISHNCQDNVKAALETGDREVFQDNVNYVLRNLIGSHCCIFDASDLLMSYLKRYPAEFNFRPSRFKSAYQTFIVTHVPETSVAKDLVKKGDTFCLPSRSEYGSNLLLNEGNSSTEYQWRLQFHSPRSKSIKFFSYKGELSHQASYQLDYEPDDQYEQKMTELGISVTLPPLIPIESFQDAVKTDQGKFYKGHHIAGALEWNIHNGSNLIIIDLRHNSGGYMHNLAHFLSYFLPVNSPYLVTINRDGWKAFQESREYQDIIQNCSAEELNPQEFHSLTRELRTYILLNKPELVRCIRLEKPLYEKDVAVLIDKGTGSAGEIAAGALKIALKDRCRLIGHKTQGAVLECYFDCNTIASGFTFYYPYRDMLLLDGTRIEGVGVTPDVRIDDTSDTEACIKAALEWHELRQADAMAKDGHQASAEEEEESRINPIFPSALEKDLILVDPYAILGAEDAEIPSHYEVSSIDTHPKARLKLIHLAEPVEGYEAVELSVLPFSEEQHIGPIRYESPENGNFMFIYRLQDGNKWKLYGMRNWNKETFISSGFSKEIHDWINSSIFRNTIERSRTCIRKLTLDKEENRHTKSRVHHKNRKFPL